MDDNFTTLIMKVRAFEFIKFVIFPYFFLCSFHTSLTADPVIVIFYNDCPENEKRRAVWIAQISRFIHINIDAKG